VAKANLKNTQNNSFAGEARAFFFYKIACRAVAKNTFGGCPKSKIFSDLTQKTSCIKIIQNPFWVSRLRRETFSHSRF
jgi:hypothetical protein